MTHREYQEYSHLYETPTILNLTKDEEILLEKFTKVEQTEFTNQDGFKVKPFFLVCHFPDASEFIINCKESEKICNKLVLKGKLKKLRKKTYSIIE